MAKTRWWAAPDTPTFDEAGVPGLHASFWHGLWAPKGTPKDVIATLHAALVETLADPAVRQRFKDIGVVVPAAERRTPEYLTKFVQSETERWAGPIKASGAVID